MTTSLTGGPLTPPGDEDLHAYVDGQLSPDRRVEVERWIARDPDAAQRAAFYTRVNAELHKSFDHVLAEPIPAKWGPVPVWKRRLYDRRAPSVRTFAIAASWLFAGIFAGWASHDLLIPPRVVERIVEVQVPITQQALVAHTLYTPEVRHPVEVRANEEHLTRWISNRMGKPIKAPDLEANGWRLMGGRLLPVSDDMPGVACQFMYENAAGLRVTLYMKSADKGEPSSFRVAEEANGVSVLYWMDTKLGYAITGKLPKDDLKVLARQVFEQFNS